MASSTLYPPIVMDLQPAFVTGGEDPMNIYFSLPPFNSLKKDGGDIAHAQVVLIDQETNQNVLSDENWPLGIFFVDDGSITNIDQDDSFPDEKRKIIGDYKYYISIPSADIIVSINKFYKIQIRFGDEELPNDIREDFLVDDHLNHFSEWSKTCLIRTISWPELILIGFNQGLNIFNTPEKIMHLTGELQYFSQNDQDKDKDTLKSYNIEIKKEANNQIFFISDEIYTNSNYNPNSFSYQLEYDLQSNINYIITINFITQSLYYNYKSYTFRVAQSASPPDFNLSVATIPEESNGSIKIVINDFNEIKTNEQLSIKRSSSRTNFSKWENIKTIQHEQSFKHIWYDTSIESGIWYKYRIIKGDFQNETQPVMCLFEDIFLTQGETQLKIQFNPNISGLKYNVSESQQITLGSKYPYIKRNGNNYFRSFSIGGLISAFMDEIYWYDPGMDNIQFYDKNSIEPFASPYKLYGETANLYEQYNKTNNINLYQDYIYEREFRQKVINFLYKNNIKLFRSLTQGNMLIKLSNISLQPITALGRRLYSFSATATEMDDFTISNLFNIYNLINKTYYTYQKHGITGKFKSGESLINKLYSETSLIKNKTDIMQLAIAAYNKYNSEDETAIYNQDDEIVIYAKPINNINLLRYTTKINDGIIDDTNLENKNILELYYSDSDPIAECYFYGLHFDSSQLNYMQGYYDNISEIKNPIDYGVYSIVDYSIAAINTYISYFIDSGLLTTYQSEILNNTKDNNDKDLLIDEVYLKFIHMLYYKGKWYLLLDNNDIVFDTFYAYIEFTYRIKKES